MLENDFDFNAVYKYAECEKAISELRDLKAKMEKNQDRFNPIIKLNNFVTTKKISSLEKKIEILVKIYSNEYDKRIISLEDIKTKELKYFIVKYSGNFIDLENLVVKLTETDMSFKNINSNNFVIDFKYELGYIHEFYLHKYKNYISYLDSDSDYISLSELLAYNSFLRKYIKIITSLNESINKKDSKAIETIYNRENETIIRKLHQKVRDIQLE